MCVCNDFSFVVVAFVVKIDNINNRWNILIRPSWSTHRILICFQDKRKLWSGRSTLGRSDVLQRIWKSTALPCFKFPWAHHHVVPTLQFMSDINRPSLPTSFYSVLVSISVFEALSTVFHSINSPDNSPFFSLCSCGLSSALLVLSTIIISLYEKFLQPWYNAYGWLGSKHQLTS